MPARICSALFLRVQFSKLFGGERPRSNLESDQALLCEGMKCFQSTRCIFSTCTKN